MATVRIRAGCSRRVFSISVAERGLRKLAGYRTSCGIPPGRAAEYRTVCGIPP